MFFKFIAFLAFKPSERINSNPFITFMTDGSVSVANNVLPPNFVWQMWTLSRITLISSSRYCVLLPPSHIIIIFKFVEGGGFVYKLQLYWYHSDLREFANSETLTSGIFPPGFLYNKKMLENTITSSYFHFLHVFYSHKFTFSLQTSKNKGGGWLC